MGRELFGEDEKERSGHGVTLVVDLENLGSSLNGCFPAKPGWKRCHSVFLLRIY